MKRYVKTFTIPQAAENFNGPTLSLNGRIKRLDIVATGLDLTAPDQMTVQLTSDDGVDVVGLGAVTSGGAATTSPDVPTADKVTIRCILSAPQDNEVTVKVVVILEP